MKKHPFRYGFTSIVVSIFSFMFAAIGLIPIFEKLLSFHLHADVTSEAYKLGYAMGHFTRAYFLPLFFILAGLLLFKFGREKVELSQTEEANS